MHKFLKPLITDRNQGSFLEDTETLLKIENFIKQFNELSSTDFYLIVKNLLLVEMWNINRMIEVLEKTSDNNQYK